MGWECQGKRLDGSLSANGAHPVEHVNGDRCPKCALSQVEVKGLGGTTTLRQTARRLSPLAYAIPIFLCAAGGGAWLVTKLIRPADDGKIASSSSQTPSSIQTPSQCPFPNCTLKLGAASRPGNSSSGGNSSESLSLIKEPTCPEATPSGTPAESNLAISSPNSTASQIDREQLRKYLEEKLQKQYPSIKVELDELVNVKRENRNKVAEERITNKTWDIAFANSPLLALNAKNQGYLFGFAAKVRGESSYETSIFVRKDSKIKALGDLNASKVVALGNPDNLIGFYMPIYDLYGTQVQTMHGNRLSQIPNLVLCKKFDAGVAQSRLIKDNPNFTILSSRTIKPGGIYLSPNLSTEAQILLKDLFRNAPENIQLVAGYDLDGKELEQSEYDRVAQIKSRAEEIMKTSKAVSNTFVATPDPNDIVGTIENIRHVTSDKDSINIKLASGKIYEVRISPALVQKLNVESDKLIKKQIVLHDIKIEENNVIQVSNVEQIRLK